MSDFVNYNHRGVNLPPGLKDMMDVLRLKDPNSPPSDTACSPFTFKNETYPNGLSHLEEYVRQFLALQIKSLSIFWGSLAFGPMLRHEHKEPRIVFFFEESDSSREASVREVFSTAGIPPTMDSLLEKTPTRLIKYPLPQLLPQAVDITTAILTTAYGITPEKRLTFLLVK